MTSLNRVPDTLAKVLVCPAPDRGVLVDDVLDGAPVLRCTTCELMFPLDGQIPVLLLSHALNVPADGLDRGERASTDPAVGADER